MKKTFDELFAMRAQHGFYSTWNLYPIATTLQDSTVDVSMVDIGGGWGQDLAAVVDKHPEIANRRFVLEDLPKTLNGIGPDALPEMVEKIAYDFFSGPQPVKGMYNMPLRLRY